MELKRLAFSFEEIKSDDETRTVEGYASVFNNVDSYKDIVMPGAFAKTLKRKKSLPMLWQHDAEDVIGKWTEMEERDKGLYVKGTISQTALGNDAYTLLKDGAVTGMSIGYATKQFEMDVDKNVRKLTEIDLYEVSLVTFPANEKAQITRVKAVDGQFMTEREFEELLRDVGLSQKEAKIVVSDGYKALLQHRDGGAEDLSRLTTGLERLVTSLNHIKL